MAHTGSIEGVRRTTALVTDGRVLFNVIATTYLLKAVTGFGYLALMWSTVVLLGGFVTVLHKKDFWCLTVISMTQAARIFDDFAEHLVRDFIIMLAGNVLRLARQEFRAFGSVVGALLRTPAAVSKWCLVFRFIYIGTIVLPFQAMSCVTMCLYRYSGPVVCIALALWRISRRDYGGDDSSNGNLMPALDLFYSLVLLQGVLYVVWALWPVLNNNFTLASTIRRYRRELGLPDEPWCRNNISRYLSNTRARFWRDPAFIRGRTMGDFAVELLDSGSWEEMLSGARLLDAYVKKGEDIRLQLLPSRPRIQKLIDVLGWREADGAREMREPAARVVAHLSGNIHLSQFPGAMDCISSLLQEETTLLTKKQDDGGSNRPNELIQQGLAILEGLASDHNNCRVICSTPGHLRKITAPLSSTDLMQEIRNNHEWAKVVSTTFKVLHKLIQAPGKSSKRLRRAIYSNKQSMNNLESILDLCPEATGLEELQMGAMGILTELALDLSINLAKETKEKLIRKLFHIFLGHGEGGDEEPLKAMAGKTLVFLSTKTESNSSIIMTLQNDIISHLTGILDAKTTTTYRVIAAQILESLCIHCDLDKQWVKETLRPKVLTEIFSTKRITPENGVSPSNDGESQQHSAPSNDEENNNISTRQDDTEVQETSLTAEQNKPSDGGNEEQTTAAKIIREAFLSLILVIQDKLISSHDFDNAVQKEGVRPAEFVTKIKDIVDDNCQETPESLRIVKLCCRIAEPMMQRDKYAQHFRNTGFVESVSNASKILSNLESCILFARTDLRLKKTTRP